MDRIDSAKIISVRNSDSTTSSTSNSSGISVSSSTQTVANNKEASAVNTSMITINSDLPDLSNSLSSNVAQVTVVTTSHPPVIIDNSVVPKPSIQPQSKSSSGNEVVIVSNETNKSLPLNESSTDDDYPSLDSLECNTSRFGKQAPGQSTIIIGDTTSTPFTPNKQPSQQQHPRARKLDESEVFIVSNEDESMAMSDNETNKTNKNLDTSHVSVVTVGDEIRVKDSSHAKTPQRQSDSSINTSNTNDM